MEEHNKKLFEEFPPVSIAEWEAKIKEDLKGADYDKKLVSKSLDGIKVKPYYTAEDLNDMQYLNQVPGSFPYVRGSKTMTNGWEIRQDFRVTDAASAASGARNAVERGATSVGFDLTGKSDLYYHDLKTLVSAIEAGKVSLNFEVGESAQDTLEFLIKALDELQIQSETVRGSLGYDPLYQLTTKGNFFRSEQDDFQRADQMLLAAENELPGFRVITIGSNLFGNAGASAVQELAFGLAMASEYFTRLSNSGHSPEDIARHIQWNLGVGSDYFMEIAKVRAARMLFSGLLNAFTENRPVEVPVFIHSITTDWNKTIYDPNVNMLRLTTEAMASVLGGCDSLLVKPFDSCYKDSGEFSERIARNVQIILKEESYFDKVVDPAAGSYYIESLTNSLVENAWQLFLTIDAKGGFVKAFLEGAITGEINKTQSQRLDMVSSRREILLGTNQYPNAQEKVAEHIDPEIAANKHEANVVALATPIIPVRAASRFEELRLAMENHKGARPKVFMLTYGNLAMRLARSQFSSGFFACGGYEIIDNLGFQSAQEGVDAAFKAKADIIVICSSDDEYATIAPEVVALVQNKAQVVVAGAPACMEELKQKGLQDFIHIRSNVLETLKGFHKRLGIIQ